MALDLARWKLFLAEEMVFSRPWRIHLLPGTEGSVKVRSSIKTLMGEASVKRITEKVHPMIIPFSSQCQFDAVFPEVVLSLRFP